MLTSYVPKARKVVLVLNSAVYNNEVDRKKGKPRTTLDYNTYKSGVDMLKRDVER